MVKQLADIEYIEVNGQYRYKVYYPDRNTKAVFVSDSIYEKKMHAISDAKKLVSELQKHTIFEETETE